jgi:NhaA family Na+:H+ antiporter
MALINLKVFKEFFRSGSIGGFILISCVAVSLLIANSPYGEGFADFLAAEIGMENESVHLRYPVLIWINDGLMAIFFLLIGLEIKRELVEGELSSVKKAALPVFAAFGGAIVPAIIFFALNKGTGAAAGWGIPMATDIAFAISVVTLLGRKVPPSLKIFLAALAIVDDLIAILVIAIFYSAELHLTYLFYALGIFALLLVFNRLNVKSLWLYLIPGIFIWYFIHHSGVHATIAGVLTAMTIPTTVGAEESPLEKLEHHLHKPVNFLIMPIFALANTNISFANASVDMLTDGLGLGIILGLLIGKPVGILLTSWITVKLKWSTLPARAHWGHILGLGILGGIGFTMSIFIALLSFGDVELQTASKFSILVASTLAGVIGYITLSAMKRKTKVSSQ